MSVLIDTNVFVDYLREDLRAITFLNQLREKPSTSIICVAELFSGAASQREERQIRQFLANVNVLTATIPNWRSKPPRKPPKPTWKP